MRIRLRKRSIGTLLALSAVLGCGSESENLSTRAADDPVRFEAAQAEARDTRERARKAEAAQVGDRLKGIEEP